MKIFMGLDYILIIAVASVRFALDMAWHSAKIFGKTWEEQTGLQRAKNGEPPLAVHIGQSFAGSFLTTAGVAYFIRSGGGTGLLNGLEIGLVLAIFFSLTAHLETAVLQKKAALYWVTAGFQAVSVIITACLLGLWMK